MAKVDRPKVDGGSEATGSALSLEARFVPPVIRSAYDGRRVGVGLVCLKSEDRTQQAFRDECDINVLMKRYEATGIMPLGREAVPQYADVSAMDFTDSMMQVAHVSGIFSQLDARTRLRFQNDPALMLDFLADPGNMEEAIKMGLMPKPKGVDDGRGKAAARVEGAGRVGGEDQAGGATGRGAVASDRGAEKGAVVGKGGNAGDGGEVGKGIVST